MNLGEKLILCVMTFFKQLFCNHQRNKRYTDANKNVRCYNCNKKLGAK